MQLNTNIIILTTDSYKNINVIGVSPILIKNTKVGLVVVTIIYDTSKLFFPAMNHTLAIPTPPPPPPQHSQ